MSATISTADAVSNSEANREWLSAKEAARYTGLGFSTLAKLRLTGDGAPFSKVGEKVLYRKIHLDSWLESRRVASAPQHAA
jgi:hypothetical protein